VKTFTCRAKIFIIFFSSIFSRFHRENQIRFVIVKYDYNSTPTRHKRYNIIFMYFVCPFKMCSIYKKTWSFSTITLRTGKKEETSKYIYIYNCCNSWTLCSRLHKTTYMLYSNGRVVKTRVQREQITCQLFLMHVAKCNTELRPLNIFNSRYGDVLLISLVLIYGTPRL